MKVGENTPIEEVHKLVIQSMRKWGRKYLFAGYGRRFFLWLIRKNPNPYRSYGNGSAMRVSSVGWLFNTLEETQHVARWTAEITHNHPEGIKGAEAVASVIFLARNGKDKEELRNFVKENFYPLNFTCDEIRPDYYFHESCQETVPQAIEAFLEGQSFVDVIRTAVSLGGDSDTLTAIAGSMAESYYGIPKKISKQVFFYLPEDLEEIVDLFYEKAKKRILRNDKQLKIFRLPWCK